jgi:hypothetical protein
MPSVGRALWYSAILTGLAVVSVLYTLNRWSQDGLKVFSSHFSSRPWDSLSSDHDGAQEKEGDKEELPDGTHPISHLMKIAEQNFKTSVASETTTLQQAATQYRKKRGRHPPPGFEAWYTYATNSSAIIVESFWDQIYDDLKPFWSIEPFVLRKQTHVLTPKISIRDGEVQVSTHNAYEKLDIWADMLRTLANAPGPRLPDMDIPFNVNDEPSMLVPWETLDTAVSMVRFVLLDPNLVVRKYSGLGDIEDLTRNYTFDPEWMGPRLTHPSSHLGPRPFWSLVRPACAPDSAARVGHVYNDIWDPEGETKDEHSAASLLPISLPELEGKLKGYVSNWTEGIAICHQPNLQGLHSAFVAPNEMSVTKKLFPLLGDNKLGVSNEILIPGAWEWNASVASPSPFTPWNSRSNTLHWRGPATQARDLTRYWTRFQRERLVSMLNATHVEIAEASIHSGNESTVGVGYAGDFRLLPANEYGLRSLTKGQLAEWVNGWADAAFTDLGCGGKNDGCECLDDYFSIAPPPLTSEEESAKYAVVVDGHGGDDSGQLTRILNQGKATLRASVYRKWYDSRLVPWLHFVPVDNTFVDLYAIMEYFVGIEVSEEARVFPHAVGEVQKHEHHFKTPGMDVEKEAEGHEMGEEHHSDEYSGNHGSMVGHEPHDFGESLSQMRKREGDDHDEAAKKIADASKEWAGKVLRREDVLVYVYRLLLEYARVVDDRRERLGWVGDLIDD